MDWWAELRGCDAMGIRQFLNRCRLLRDYNRGRVRTAGFPAHLKIELTNLCNLSCPLCARSKMTRPVGYMEEPLYRRIIDWGSRHSCEFAYLHFLGESLFHPQVVDLIRIAHSRRIRVGLSTNATALGERMARQLVCSGLDLLVIAIDSPDPREYERLRPGAAWTQVVENTKRFARLAKDTPNGLRVVVQMTYCDSTAQRVREFTRLWESIEIDRDHFRVMVKQWDDWAGQMAENREWNPLTLPPRQSSSRPCVLPWRELSFQWDGTVVPCSRIFDRQLVVGNASNTELSEIWNGQQMQAIRLAHVTDAARSLPVCTTCPRHHMDGWGFLSRNQFRARLQHYLYSSGVEPKMGLS